jgi:GAF domain-containing protein
MIGERVARLAEATDSVIALLRGGRRMEEVAQAALERLANAARCEWGAYWALDPTSQRLQAVASWSALGPKGERFEQDTRVRTLAPNQDNAGQVWRSRKPIWTTNLALDMSLPRSFEASEAGLRGGVWFAVKTDTAVYGVIELLARTLPYKNSETLAVVERVGFRLGYVLEELRREPSRLH